MEESRRTTWEERLAPLIEHRRWALVGRYATFNAAQVAASNLRNRKLRVPRGEWRFVAKRTEGRSASAAVLFARYLGD
ncbi:MAG: hypothetical protein ACRD0D_04010 [Acidimicrobiales bacterium]